MRFIFAIVPLLLSTTALAAEEASQNAQSNIFNADLSNPDLALAVSHFEETCMPFVLHETKLSWEQDKKHMAKLMESRGFAYHSKSTQSERINLGPNPEYEKIKSAPEPETETFTVFDGTKNHEVIIPRSQWPKGYRYRDKRLRRTPQNLYKNITRRVEIYESTQDERLSANILWNFPIVNPPGKSCGIRIATPNLTQAEFSTAFIEKDNDWDEEKKSWSQCVRDGEAGYLFKVQHQSNSLSLKVNRLKHYEKNFCEE